MDAIKRPPAIVSYTSFFLREMMAQHRGEAGNIGVLLTGDPGIGKTSYVKLLCEVLGLKAVIIEVPHITEEHLINIPFLVLDGASGQQTTGSQKVSYKMVLADSNLFTQLNKATKTTDEQYLANMQKANKHVQDIFIGLGGNATTIPPKIKAVRDSFKVILFFDESLRKTSERIRNCLRDILNGNIGNHIIPKDAYVVYASNTRDAGLDVIPENTEYKEINHPAPTKDTWFEWLESKFTMDTHVQLNTAVLNKFKKILTDDEISYRDVIAEVNTSPRRWEQMLLYINSSLPARDDDHARALLTNVKNNFINYDSGAHSKLHTTVVKAVAELIKETSNITIAATDTSPDTEWRDAFSHMVEQCMKQGEHRRHIPTISGPPGIGKTTYIQHVAAEHDMLLIELDTSSLNAEDVIGMPLPDEYTPGDTNIEVEFSRPKLYGQIVQKIEEKTAKYEAAVHAKYASNPEEGKKTIEAFKAQKYKYLILFDEINATSEKVFNALRGVLLERTFGNDNKGGVLKVPEGSVIVAAMNPHRHGTSKLTQHFRDIADIVPSEANWAATKAYLLRTKFTGIDKDIHQIGFNLLTTLINKFESHESKYKATKEFRLQLSQVMDPVQVSPREYTTMLGVLCREIDGGLEELHDNNPNIKIAQIRKELDKIVTKAFELSMGFIFTKKELIAEKDDFFDKLGTWIKSLPDSVYGQLLQKKVDTNSMSSILKDYLTSNKSILTLPENEQLITSHNNMDNGSVIKELKTLFTDTIIDAAAVKRFLMDETEDKVEADGDDLKSTGKKVSPLENFVLGYIFTLHIHGYSNDRLKLVIRALPDVSNSKLNELLSSGKIDEDVKDDANEAIMFIMSAANKLLQSL